MEQKEEIIKFYVCSLIDILGQKEKLIQLDGLNSQKDKEYINSVFKQTYGVVKKFREDMKNSTDFFNELKAKNALNTSFSSNNIEIKAFSDLIISYLSLENNQNDLKSKAIYLLLISNCEVFLNLLANGVALRGGIDIGMAIKTEEDEIYGTALLKPYILESKIAKSIRIVIGQELYNHIQHVISLSEDSNKSTEYKHNVIFAKLCMKLIKQDSDGEYILDYLSDEFKKMESFQELSKKAKLFLDTQYNDLRLKSQFEIAKKYQQAIKYFEANDIFA